MDESVPVQEQPMHENEYFQFVQNDQRRENAYDISPLKTSAYSVRASSVKRNTTAFDESTADSQLEQGTQLLKLLQEKQSDNRVQNFLSTLNQEQPSERYQQYQYHMQNQTHHQQQPHQPHNQPQHQQMQKQSQAPLMQQVPQGQQNSEPQVTESEQWQIMRQLAMQQMMQSQLQQQQTKQPLQQPQRQPQFPPERNSNEIFQMYTQIISFYDKNLNNLKNIIVQKDQELLAKEDKLRDLGALVNQMKQSFHMISQKYETENQELMKRYMSVMEEHANQRLEEEHRHQADQIMMEYVQLKQQHVELSSHKMTLEIRVKDLEIKHQSDQLRMNDQRMKIEYLQNEVGDLSQAKSLLEQQNMQLLQQFDQMKQQHMQEIQRIFAQQEQLQHQHQLQQHQIQQQQHQLKQQTQQISYHQQQIITQPISYNQSKTPMSQGYQIPYELPQQHSIESNRSKASAPRLPEVNMQGILGFPSDQKYYNQMDEINTLHKDLQEFSARKQQLESELNKRTSNVKGMQEKKRREQLEHEMEDVIEAINKVKLKLREFKQL